MIQVRNLDFINDANCIMVDNYFKKQPYEVWNCPDNKISKNTPTIGVWKIKQLKK